MRLRSPKSLAIDITVIPAQAESEFRFPGDAEWKRPTMRAEVRAPGTPLALSGVRVTAICQSGGFRSASSFFDLL